jgi:hypothetical protein
MKTVIAAIFLPRICQGCEIRATNYYACPEHGIKKNTILNTPMSDNLSGKKTRR